MVIGGSTTSLLSILNTFDYNTYDITLLLLDDSGDLQHLINPKVRVIVVKYPSKLIRILSPLSWFSCLLAEILSRNKGNRLIKAQINSTNLALSMPRLNEEFDIAISFLEFWPQRYVANNVIAKQKISWIHIDPYEAGLIPKYSNKYLSKVDRIVLVSKSCKENFDKLYPSLSGKSVVIENILDARIIQQLSKEPLSDFHINDRKKNLVSVCRINLASKGLDRVVFAMKKIKDSGTDIESMIDWYIIGDGPDYDRFKSMIIESGLNNIYLLGKQLNPYKFEKLMHYFILPSRYEGKPMAITESQMIGLVPIVCNYSSASEQIINRVDGIIVANNDESIIEPLKDILDDSIPYAKYRHNIMSKDYSNTHIIQQIYNLFDNR